MRISDWSSDVCSSDLIVLADKRRKNAQIGLIAGREDHAVTPAIKAGDGLFELAVAVIAAIGDARAGRAGAEIPHRFNGALDAIGIVGEAEIVVGSEKQHPLPVQHAFRSEEHTSELQSLMRTSYAVFCLKKKNNTQHHKN